MFRTALAAVALPCFLIPPVFFERAESISRSGPVFGIFALKVGTDRGGKATMMVNNLVNGKIVGDDKGVGHVSMSLAFQNRSYSHSSQKAFQVAIQQ